jgi:tetratricopeptide (TPR) repeat protein
MTGPGAGHASPYSTGGGGVLLEHAYGAAALTALLLQAPTDGLGDDFTTVEVSFQQPSPVDDLVVSGRSEGGDRRIFVGVRRDPTIAPGSVPFVVLIVDYLRMLISDGAEFAAGRWALGLAVAGPHTGATEVRSLAQIAARQSTDAAFRAAVARPRACTGKVRTRLDYLDDVVKKANQVGDLGVTSDAELSRLTWRLLGSLSVLQLRLEGDDAPDRTSMVRSLVPLATSTPRAAELWRRLTQLAGGYAQHAAVVDLPLLLHDLVTGGIRLASPEPALAADAVGEDAFRERMVRLPAIFEARVLDAWRDDHAATSRLVSALTRSEEDPVAVLRRWEDYQPRWLAEADWPVLIAAGELAGGYGRALLSADLFLAAVQQGAPRRSYWLARAALIFRDNDDTERVRAAVEACDPATITTEPLAHALQLVLASKFSEASAVLLRWTPTDSIDRFLRTVLLLQLAATEDGTIVVNRRTVDAGLRVLDEALRGEWMPGLGIARARLFIQRVQLSGSVDNDADLRSARQLAVRARDERRRFRGDSVEPAELACQAALMLLDFSSAVRLGTEGDDGATPTEAASPVVSEHVAMAALHSNALDLAREAAQRVTDPAVVARLQAMFIEAEGGNAQDAWTEAADIASDDNQLALALAGLAGVGRDDHPRLLELSARRPETAEEIRAIADITAGRPGDAIIRLRTGRRTSIVAALNLANAYQVTGDTDAQVRTLVDAANDFHDVSLRLAAAQALASAGRHRDAEAHLDQLLTTTSADWSGRSDAMRMAAKLAVDRQDYDKTQGLLQAIIQAEPADTVTRWNLIRLLVHRGEPDLAWRALADAPDDPDPNTETDARLWIMLNIRFGDAQHTVDRSLRLLRRFDDSEEFSAFVVTNLMLAGNTLGDLPDEVLALTRAEIDRFFDRFPTSRYISRISGDDIPALVDRMTESVRPTEDQRATRRRLHRSLVLGAAPISILAAIARRSYTEALVRRSSGLLPARLDEASEISACIVGAEAGIDQDVIVDVSAVTVLYALSLEVRQATESLFGRVLVTDEARLDAQVAAESLGLRSTDTWVYDEHRGHARFDTISEDEAARLAAEAAGIQAVICGFPHHPRPITRTFDDRGSPALAAWTSALDLAVDRRTILWSDDPVQRSLARSHGLAATSTTAILDVLMQRGMVSMGDHEAAIRTLIRKSVGDMPFDEMRLLDLAEDECWRPTFVAQVLARPASWRNPIRAATLLHTLLRLVRSNCPESAPNWLYLAVRGATAANIGRPADATDAAARLLALAIHESGAHGQAVLNLIEAARLGLAEMDDPDLPPSADPVPTSAVLLRNIVASVTSPGTATLYVNGTFSGLPQADRNAIARRLLE